MDDTTTLVVPNGMLARLLEHVEGGNYCYLCDQHPGKLHTKHARNCPLWRDPGSPYRDGEEYYGGIHISQR